MPVNGGICTLCDATVEYVITEARGRRMALDVDADPGGNVVLVDTPAGPRARVFGRRVEPNVAGPRRMPHVATCPRRDGDRYITVQRRRRRPPVGYRRWR